MSKLYDNYKYLKENDNNSDQTLYLFKSGIFFILLDDDAKIASQLLNLKLTYFTGTIFKCGFPLNSLEKYTSLLNQTNYNFKIIDNVNKTSYTISNYSIDKNVKDLLLKICEVDTNSLSIKEAYSFIDTIKLSAESIIRGEIEND